MKTRTIIPFLAVALLSSTSLYGCGLGGVGDVTCSSSSTIDTAEALIKQEVEKKTNDSVKSGDGSLVVSLSSIRASIDLLKISLQNIITTKSDPNSSKKFCTAQVKITVPLSMLTDADQVRSKLNLTSVGQIADAASVTRDADSLSFDMEYNTQATDDKKSVFVASESFEPQIEAVANIVEASLLKAAVASREAANNQQAEQQKQDAAKAAQADHDQAVNDNNASNQAILAAWNALDVNTRARLLPLQRDWIASKTASCKAQAASASTDVTAQEIARLKCDTTENQSRIAWLAQNAVAVPQ